MDIFNLEHQVSLIAKFTELSAFQQIHNFVIRLAKFGARFFNCVENFCHDNVWGSKSLGVIG